MIIQNPDTKHTLFINTEGSQATVDTNVADDNTILTNYGRSAQVNLGGDEARKAGWTLLLWGIKQFFRKNRKAAEKVKDISGVDPRE